jgi:hypothetical protein
LSVIAWSARSLLGGASRLTDQVSGLAFGFLANAASLRPGPASRDTGLALGLPLQLLGLAFRPLRAITHFVLS